MKGKCYYCNKELTERTIKRHMKSCSIMKNRIEESIAKNGKLRKQFIIAIKPRYEKNEYCIYLSIDGTLGLVHIDQFIKDVWVECCGHLSAFVIKKKFYQDNEMNIRLNEILSIGEKFQYEYDFGSTTYLELEVVDIIDVSKDFTQIEIIARNNEVINQCEACGAEAKYFHYEEDKWLCKNCIDEGNDMISEFNYCNSPRDGVCGYEGHKEAENRYLPNNDEKYTTSKKGSKDQGDYEDLYDDDLFDDLSDIEDAYEDLLSKSKNIMDNIFSKGIYSFDIKELISNLAKDNLYDIARYLGMTKISGLNKSKLIERFLDEYETLIEARISLFDEERYKFLKKYADNGGTKFLDKIDEENMGKIIYFIANGMLFAATKDGSPLLIMPEVIQKLIKDKNNIEYRNIIKTNSEIINLFRGMNKAYGILPLEDIKELFKRYKIEESERYRIEDVIIASEDYYQEYESDKRGTYFINIDVEDWLDLLEELEKEELNYAMISKEELISMSDENWIIKTKSGKAFSKEFFSMFNADEEILEGLIESLYLEIQEAEFEDVISEMLEQFEDDNREVQDFMYNSLGRFLRNIRLWKYKGATINEKKGTEISKEKQKTVGRNEPCICGSGKKYKKCCAKNGNVIKLF